jgi:K+-sensing histidine kinase KdpD
MPQVELSGAECMTLGPSSSVSEVAARLRRWATPVTVSIGLVAVTTALLWLLDAQLKQEHLIFVYFAPAAWIAIRYGSVAAMCATFASTLAAAFFLYSPRLSFLVDNPLEVLELVLFGMLAVLASQVVAGFARDRQVIERRLRD